jgi:hypothetical protein
VVQRFDPEVTELQCTPLGLLGIVPKVFMNVSRPTGVGAEISALTRGKWAPMASSF